jgi:hypothetical protein
MFYQRFTELANQKKPHTKKQKNKKTTKRLSKCCFQQEIRQRKPTFLPPITFIMPGIGTLPKRITFIAF